MLRVYICGSPIPDALRTWGLSVTCGSSRAFKGAPNCSPPSTQEGEDSHSQYQKLHAELEPDALGIFGTSSRALACTDVIIDATSRSSNGSRSEPLSETFSSEVPMSTLRAAIALKAAPKEIPLNTPMVATGMTASRSDAMGLVAARAPRISAVQHQQNRDRKSGG